MARAAAQLPHADDDQLLRCAAFRADRVAQRGGELSCVQRYGSGKRRFGQRRDGVEHLAQLRAPGQVSLNASAFKYFRIYERMRAELRLEAINATNHPWFNAPGTNMSSTATFGVITGASNPRAMQAGLKILF